VRRRPYRHGNALSPVPMATGLAPPLATMSAMRVAGALSSAWRYAVFLIALLTAA
jgi:hypothetical protein